MLRFADGEVIPAQVDIIRLVEYIDENVVENEHEVI